MCTNAPVTSVPPVAGGASGTEISACILSGAVVDSCNNPVPGCIVKLRPLTYLAGIDTAVPGAVQDDSTNAEGRFSLDSVQPGEYRIEVAYTDSFGRSIEVSVDSAESLKVLVPTMIQPIATIYGNNLPLLPEMNASVVPCVREMGTERIAPIDPAGHFEMKVPQGWCRLHFQGVDTTNYQGDTVLFVKGGIRYNVMPPQNFLFPCESLSCEMAYVQELLDSNGLTTLTPESVTVVESGHVTELHLRGRAIHVLPPTVCWLFRLKVIDVGKNFLHELPFGIGNMRKLTVLRADSNWIGYLPPLDWLTVLRELDLSYNWLQSLPQSIGKLSALKELDLSYNWLPTLPLPITGLKPTVLNLNVNFMCAPGNTIEQWANQYAPGWKDRQYCNFSSPNGPY